MARDRGAFSPFLDAITMFFQMLSWIALIWVPLMFSGVCIYLYINAHLPILFLGISIAAVSMVSMGLGFFVRWASKELFYRRTKGSALLAIFSAVCGCVFGLWAFVSHSSHVLPINILQLYIDAFLSIVTTGILTTFIVRSLLKGNR
jgi:hypothetical protein